MVAEGVAIALPEAETYPPPWSRKTDVAPETLQLSVEFPPALMLEGLATKKLITGSDGEDAAITITVTDLVTVPPGPVAVKV